MRFILQRYSDNRKSTLGLLFIESVHEGKTVHVFLNYTLEDEYRDVKVMKETRIPAGTYKLGIRKEITPLTQKYIDRYSWFKRHIEILNVPGFTGCYLHIGNYETDTDGCILFGDNADNNRIGDGSVSNSTQSFQRFYNNYYDDIEAGGCTIEVRDEQKLI